MRWQAGRLEDIRQHALTVTVLSWESPAGRNFRNYLSERCSEIGSTIELLEAAARDLAEYGRLVRDTELLQRRAGQ